MACTILMIPATPAAACACPMFDFTDPSHSGRPSGRSCPYVASNACASIGSPSRVPVPWPSTTSTPAVLTPALASACLMTRCCDGPFGAVSPLLAPSWFTALPATTASTRCPSRCASDSRSTTKIPAPSAQPVPSAAAANDLHRPSGARPRCRENSTNVAGVAITVTPPASASDDSPLRTDWHARCRATSDDEHAVSTDTAGPSSPSTYATRPDATLAAPPVIRCPSPSPGPAGTPAPYPLYPVPTNTPALLPRIPAGSIPACSSASQQVSSSSRCCGSIASASRGEIPKNSGSNPAASPTNPPSRAYEVPG